MRKRRRGMRPDQLELAASSRAMGLPWHEIAVTFRRRYRVNGLVAMRLAHGWSQRDAADEWNRRWPDEIKTFKNFSYWENWPSPTAYAPSLAVLSRLAEMYQCSVVDLLHDAPDFRHLDPFFGAHPELSHAPTAHVLAIALEAVLGRLSSAEVEEVAQAGLVWAARLAQPGPAYAVLMKLSAGFALAATAHAGFAAVCPPEPAGGDGGQGDLVGIWHSRCERRLPGLPGDHMIVLRNNRGRLLGQSLPHPTGARLRIDLTVQDRVLSGTWVEHAAADGGPTLHGSLRLVPDPDRRAMRGRWIGFGEDGFQVHGGAWVLEFMEGALSGSTLLAHLTAA